MNPHRHCATTARLHSLARAPLLVLACLSAATAVIGSAAAQRPAAASTPGVINAIGAENEYANVLSQIGGKYVHVSSILNNPNTDPHTYEASPSVAQEVSSAQLIVQNGVGYDTFMNTIEAASPNSARRVLVVQHLLGLPDNTPNPHLWYSPRTMPVAAKAMTTQLSTLQPAHAAYFPATWPNSTSPLRPGCPPSVPSRPSTAARRPPPPSPSPTTSSRRWASTTSRPSSSRRTS